MEGRNEEDKGRESKMESGEEKKRRKGMEKLKRGKPTRKER